VGYDADEQRPFAAEEPREAFNDSATRAAGEYAAASLSPDAEQHARPPHAETGMIAAVTLRADGTSPDEQQDASRTTAETRPVKMPEGTVGGHRPTALVVEDTPELADMVEATLRRIDIDVIVASRGEHAVQQMAESMPDLVLLDIHLPDMTGWKVLEHIKERSRSGEERSPVVIVITAYGDPANRLVGKLQGVHNYLIKPLRPDEIQQVVKSALNVPH
jgi:CheY-like chemotaxis protein